MTHRERDLCPGYQAGHTGTAGICCCGLYWQGEMPAHDEQGRLIMLERIIARKIRLAVARGHRRRNHVELRRNGVPMPLMDGFRPRRWK